jgi:hypothetical protein
MTFTLRAAAALAATCALLASCASQGGSPTEPAQGAGSPPPPSSTASPATSEIVLGGLDTDQPCTATLADGKALPALGIALHEVAAMTLDPAELGLTGDDWWRTSGYTDNYQYTQTWPEACEVARRYGRVTGHQQRATPDTEESTYTQLQVDVDLFQSPEGADAWVTWFAEPHDADRSAGPTATRVVEPLPGLGDRAVLITSKDGNSEGSVLMLRRGRIVGDVYVWADAGEPPILDVREVARRLDERILATPQTGRPVDVVVTMAAPLPLSAWGDGFEGWSWSWAGYAGGLDNRTFVEHASDPELTTALVEDHRRLVGYQATYGAPDAPGWIATGTTTYPDEEAATAAMDLVVADKVKGDTGSGNAPAERFDVPDVRGAVGLVRTADGELVTDVYFVRGTDVARVYRVRKPPEGEPPEAGVDDRALIADMARQFSERLEALVTH